MTMNASRMTLGSITSTRAKDKPLKIVLYAAPGLGKSTFASQAPSPVFLCGEDGAGFLDVKAFPRPQSWRDVVEAVQVLQETEHAFKTLVIDTLDGLEPLLWEHLCKVNNKRNIEEFGFGKGYVLAADEWARLLVKLETLQSAKGMHVILIAHAVAKEFKDPTQEASWKHWDLCLHTKATEKIGAWVDAILFGTHEAIARKEGLRVRGISTGERLLHTEWTAAYSAKNRYGLPPTMPLSWEAFWSAAQPALRPGPVGPTEAETRECDQLCGSLDTLLPQLEGNALAAARGTYRDTPKSDLAALRTLHKRVIVTLEKQSAERRAREEQLRADAAAAREAREAAPTTTSPEADDSAA